jgi:hypothetical protein
MRNTERADLALKALVVATDWKGDETPEEIETYAGDLIANLKHLCGQKGIDFNDVLERGESHFNAEYEGDDIMEPGDQDEPGRTFIDATGAPYPAAMLYYQPHESNGVTVDVVGNKWPKNAVWTNEGTCQRLFPTHEINAFSGNMIAKPLFVG